MVMILNRSVFSRIIAVVLAFVFLSILSPVGVAAGDDLSSRNPGWAVPVEKPGLENFHKVSNVLYRGKLPTAEGIRELNKMGIKTIVNLQSSHSDLDTIEEAGLSGQIGYEEVKSEALNPTEEEVSRFLSIVTDPDKTPVFVHCAHGADRTGLMCAVYRVTVQGWPKEDAIKEMKEGGYGFHSIWSCLPRHVKKMDVEALRQKSRMNAPRQTGFMKARKDSSQNDFPEEDHFLFDDVAHITPDYSLDEPEPASAPAEDSPPESGPESGTGSRLKTTLLGGAGGAAALGSAAFVTNAVAIALGGAALVPLGGALLAGAGIGALVALGFSKLVGSSKLFGSSSDQISPATANEPGDDRIFIESVPDGKIGIDSTDDM